jgi:hypothetical protein
LKTSRFIAQVARLQAVTIQREHDLQGRIQINLKERGRSECLKKQKQLYK